MTNDDVRATTLDDGTELLVAPDPERASAIAARRIVDVLGQAIADRGVAHWSTTGGSTPLPIYRTIIETDLAGAIDWTRVHLWWGDDRFVPHDHPLSNALPAIQVLLDAPARLGMSGTGEGGFRWTGELPGVAIPAEQVHYVPVDQALAEHQGQDWAAARYAETLRGAGLDLDEAGFPIVDMVLLGLGGDGHLFSVFPGSAVWDSDAWVQGVPAPTHIEPHVPRVTMHPRVITAARHVLMVTHGAEKADVVGRVLGGEPADLRELPSRIARRPGATWILDEASAAKLGGPGGG